MACTLTKRLNGIIYENDVNVVFLGDSNTGGSSFPEKVPAKLYPKIINDNYLKDNTINVSSINSGVSGYTVDSLTTNIQTKLYDFADTAADKNFAFMMIGTNDILVSEEDAATVWAEILPLLQAVKNKGWDLTIMSVLPKDGDATSNAIIRTLNALILANTGVYGYNYINLYDEVVTVAEGDTVKDGYVNADNVHYTQLGHDAFASAIIEMLDVRILNKLNGAKVAILKDIKATTVSGGSSAAVTENVRDITNIISNEIGVSLSLATNTITIDDTGEYMFEAEAPGFATNRHKLILKNETTGVKHYGSTEYAVQANLQQTESVLSAKLWVNAGDELKFYHYTQSLKSATGLGIAGNDGGVETYLRIKITKLK